MYTDKGDYFLIDGAPKRHPELFAMLYEVRDILSDWIDHPELKESPETALAALRLSVALRTWNLYKAVVPLLERDLWEDATILIRSLFELLLNVEYIDQIEAESESKARRFFLFEELQLYHHTVSEYEYNVHTGRITKDNETIAKLTAMAEQLFATFRVKDKQKRVRWAKTWCGKNVFELAQASSQPIRVWQYKLLYSYGSAFAHATPLAVLSTFHRNAPGTDWAEVATKQLQGNFISLRETASLLMTFTLELIMRVSPSLPKFKGEVVLGLFPKMRSLWDIKIAAPSPYDQRDALTDISTAESKPMTNLPADSSTST